MEAIDEMLKKKEELLFQLRKNLVKAQERMKRFAHSKRSERHFAVGDWVYLRLKPYRQVSIQGKGNAKLNSN